MLANESAIAKHFDPVLNTLTQCARLGLQSLLPCIIVGHCGHCSIFGAHQGGIPTEHRSQGHEEWQKYALAAIAAAGSRTPVSRDLPVDCTSLYVRLTGGDNVRYTTATLEGMSN